MDDADAGRHDLERIERLHAPLEKLVAFAVPLELHLQIFLHRDGGAGKIHLHRVVHHQVHRHQRLDELRVFAQLLHRRAHRRQIHQERHTGEILQHDARDHERNFLRAGFGRLPICQRADCRLAHAFAVAIAEDGLEHEADGDGQLGNRADPGRFQCRQRVKLPRLAVAGIKELQRVKQIVRYAHLMPSIRHSK